MCICVPILRPEDYVILCFFIRLNAEFVILVVSAPICRVIVWFVHI